MIRAVALASGSNGNAIWVETPDARLLVDAGIAGRTLSRRAESLGVNLGRADALVVTHNHSDHVSSVGVVHRWRGVPVLATDGTLAASRERLGRLSDVRAFRPGDQLRFGKTVVHTLLTPHDGVEGVCVVVESGGVRLGILTDLGHLFSELVDLVPTLDAAFIESNYDPAMLDGGPYPQYLKERIVGPRGHLSNEECVAVALAGAGGRLRHVVLSHLSGKNNSPEVALERAAALAERGLTVGLAGRDGPSGFLVVAAG